MVHVPVGWLKRISSNNLRHLQYSDGYCAAFFFFYSLPPCLADEVSCLSIDLFSLCFCYFCGLDLTFPPFLSSHSTFFFLFIFSRGLSEWIFQMFSLAELRHYCRYSRQCKKERRMKKGHQTWQQPHIIVKVCDPNLTVYLLSYNVIFTFISASYFLLNRCYQALCDVSLRFCLIMGLRFTVWCSADVCFYLLQL